MAFASFCIHLLARSYSGILLLEYYAARILIFTLNAQLNAETPFVLQFCSKRTTVVIFGNFTSFSDFWRTGIFVDNAQAWWPGGWSRDGRPNWWRVSQVSKKTDETVVRQEWEKERRQWIATGRKDCESISIVHIPTLGTYYLQYILYNPLWTMIQVSCSWRYFLKILRWQPVMPLTRNSIPLRAQADAAELFYKMDLDNTGWSFLQHKPTTQLKWLSIESFFIEGQDLLNFLQWIDGTLWTFSRWCDEDQADNQSLYRQSSNFATPRSSKPQSLEVTV